MSGPRGPPGEGVQGPKVSGPGCKNVNAQCFLVCCARDGNLWFTWRQGDRGSAGERGLKGIRGDLGDAGVPGESVRRANANNANMLPC